ncbi:hypothetical protein RAS2_32260 [Phycisphaerae bacterium RAS2]|nr:hypothetical protein RAS2_32260 [Phycisphaerae bacterium RAS2]
MKSPNSKKEHGIVAILDALGAANYSDEEIMRFIDSREQVMQLLEEKALKIGDAILPGMLKTFTFNDTVLIILRTRAIPPTLDQITKFFTLMRKFFVDSLEYGILFRGAVALGEFYLNDDTNTVLGNAVTDAAAWYDKADWIGIHATPRASLIIQQMTQNSSQSKKEHLILNYAVPVKDGRCIPLKAVNWPKVFNVPALTPCQSGEEPKEKLLQFLSNHRIPFGTEGKFANTIAFFDYAMSTIQKSNPVKPLGPNTRARL